MGGAEPAGGVGRLAGVIPAGGGIGPTGGGGRSGDALPPGGIRVVDGVEVKDEGGGGGGTMTIGELATVTALRLSYDPRERGLSQLRFLSSTQFGLEAGCACLPLSSAIRAFAAWSSFLTLESCCVRSSSCTVTSAARDSAPDFSLLTSWWRQPRHNAAPSEKRLMIVFIIIVPGRLMGCSSCCFFDRPSSVWKLEDVARDSAQRSVH